MLFDAAAFEQYFTEADLRKGYKLYEKGAVSLLTRNNLHEARYHIGTEEGVLKKKSSRVLAWNCECGHDYCQHLAALMFYLHHAKLEMPQARSPKKQFNPLDQVFLGSKRARPNGQSDGVFSSGLQKLEKYGKKIHAAAALQIKLKVIDSKSAIALRDDVTKLFAEQSATFREDDIFYFSLAVVKELIPLFIKLDHIALEEINQLTAEFYAKIDKYFVKGLTEEQAKAWKAITNESIKNNRALYSPAFSFLIPRTLLIPPDRDELRALRILLHKRTYVLKNAVDFDPVTIARHQVLVMQKGDFLEVTKKESNEPPEYYIALSDLHFVAKHKRKAFAVLLAGLQHIDKVSIQYQEYLENALMRARQHEMPDMERLFLKELFIYGLFIRSVELERFMFLAGPGDAEQQLQLLQKEIRNSDPYYFEKMSLLLMAGRQFDDLIALIARQPERFMLLHDVVMKKGGVPDQKLLNLYRKHLLSLLQKTENIAMHQKVITRAMLFFKSVPPVQRLEICEDLLAQIGRNKPVYRYLESVLHSPNLPA